MPCENYVIKRMGQEVKNFLNNFRSKASTNTASGSLAEEQSEAGAPSAALMFERHRWLYDRLSLARLLAEIGFREIEVCAHDVSRIPDHKSYHLDTLEDGQIRKPDSFFMEGVKPA